MKYRVTVSEEGFYDLVVEASSENEAISLARKVIVEDNNPPWLHEYYESNPERHFEAELIRADELGRDR